jgi:chaperonin GroES
MTKFRPLHDRLLVERIEQESKTPGGIIIPDTAKEKPMEGKVIAAGKGIRDDNGNIRVEDSEATFIELQKRSWESKFNVSYIR